jgi:hypothetical protein
MENMEENVVTSKNDVDRIQDLRKAIEEGGANHIDYGEEVIDGTPAPAQSPEMQPEPGGRTLKKKYSGAKTTEKYTHSDHITSNEED